MGEGDGGFFAGAVVGLAAVFVAGAFEFVFGGEDGDREAFEYVVGLDVVLHGQHFDGFLALSFNDNMAVEGSSIELLKELVDGRRFEDTPSINLVLGRV